MSLSDEELRKYLDILTALDKTIEEGPWEETLFLRGIGKKLKEARERFVRDSGLDKYTDPSQTSHPVAGLAAQDAQAIDVYVSLYQAEGVNIRKWAIILNSLPALSITRPIYKNEEDIQAAIRTKTYQINDAYAVVRINKDDMLKPTDDKPPVDRYGRELLVLREGAVRTENVVRFIHTSGVYQFRNGMLVK